MSEAPQCMTDYHAKAYGQRLCVGDTYTDPDGGSHIVTSIWEGQPVTSPAPWTAEDTYEEAGKPMGFSMEDWKAFTAELHALNAQVEGIVNPLFTNQDKVEGRLGIRIKQANPDWTEEQVQQEVLKMMDSELKGKAKYQAAVEAENALFEKYGISKRNPTVYGTGGWVDAEGKNYSFNSQTGQFTQLSQDPSFLDYVVPIGVGIGASVIGGQFALGLAGALTGGTVSGIAAGAVSGAGGSALSGAVNGDFNVGDIAKGALTGGIMAGVGDYLQDTIDGVDLDYKSDIGGLFGESGLLGDELVSTKGFNEFLFGIGSEEGRQAVFNAANEYLGMERDLGSEAVQAIVDQGGTVGWKSGLLNNQVTNAVTDILTPVLDSKPGQWAQDALTQGLLGYNDDWREHQSVGVDANGNTYTEIDWANMSESDIYNYKLFEAAQQTGMWRLDEQYMFSTTPRDPNSTLLGVLPKPIEEGGQIKNPSAANPNSNTDDESESTGGESTDGEQGNGLDGSDGTETGNEQGAVGDLNGDGALPSNSNGWLGGVLDGLLGFDGVGSKGPNAGGSNAPPLVSSDGNAAIIADLEQAILQETDPDVLAGLQNALDNYRAENTTPAPGLGTDVLDGGDLPTRQDQVLGLLNDTRLSLGSTDQRVIPPGEDELPPPPTSGGGGGGAALAGLLAAAGGDGVNPLWGPLYDYTNIKKWQKARERVFEDIAGLVTPMEGGDPMSGLSKREAEEQGLLS